MSRTAFATTAALLSATVFLSGCEGPGGDEPAPPSLDEQAALEKAETMIEESRNRLESDAADVEEIGSEE